VSPFDLESHDSRLPVDQHRSHRWSHKGRIAGISIEIVRSKAYLNRRRRVSDFVLYAFEFYA
jgi:hypothetical protein